ncbi:MAG: CPBP family intramembrane metalloprotease [Thermoplasmata archaeon]|nr:CPBP family intramembrane metalloprotease [Thermoplasmata archaeon]
MGAGGAASSDSATPVPRSAPVRAYLLATVITVVAVVSQYLLPERFPSLLLVYGNLPGELAIVYGIPILAFLFLVGPGPLRAWNANPGRAAVEGLRWFGLLSLLALLLSIVLLIVYEVVDPSAVRLLSKSVPVVRGAASDPWFWIALSFAVGAIEETIFRGWIFGYWLARSPAQWRSAAAMSSLLFAGAHVYYWTTYGAIATVPLLMLVLLGLAFAWAMALSGGNLVVVALLHGAFDASSFYSVVNTNVALGLHYGLVLLGLVVALVVAVRTRLARPPPEPFRPVPSPLPPSPPFG